LSAKTVTDLPFNLTPLELARIAPMEEASRLSGLSKEALRVHHRDKIVELTPGGRRHGMRVGDALMLKPPETDVKKSA
jgi:hypothetical protein